MSEARSRPKRGTLASRLGRWPTLIIVGCVLILAVIADRAGLFGTSGVSADFDRYDMRTFRVVRVLDGDTVELNVPDGDRPATRVRLWGVDTPEVHHPDRDPEPFGAEASEFTRHAAQDKTVRVVLEKRRTRDVYGRLLAYLIVLPEETMLNRELVREGYAFADPRFDHSLFQEFHGLQEEAIKARRGMWAALSPEEAKSRFQ